MRWSLRQRRAWWAAVLGVVLAHALALAWLRSALVPLTPGGIQRFETVYARRVQIAAEAPRVAAAAPAAPAPAHRRAAERPAAAPAEVAASQPPVPPPPASEPLASEPPQGKPPVEPASAAASASAPASAVAAAASSPAAAAASAAAAATPFEWPRSTRIRYHLSGWYRGELSGSAQVEWLRSGDRYQVHLDVDASVVSRRMSSEGRLGPAGLLPQRYEEVTKVLLAAPRLRQMRFDDQTVTLASGETVPRTGAAGELQDTASQFIQMMYAFSTQPELLRPGGRLALQLALTHRVRPVLYEVAPQEWTEAPGGGWIETWPVRPRIAPEAVSGKELSVEAWLAPRLQMLPVRIRIRQDAENYLDLRIEQLPEQAR